MKRRETTGRGALGAGGGGVGGVGAGAALKVPLTGVLGPNAAGRAAGTV